MNKNQFVNGRSFVKNSVEAAMRIAFVALLIFWSYNVISPFISTIGWGIILAVAIYPHYSRLEKIMGGRKGLAASLYTLLLLILLILPTILLGSTIAENFHSLAMEIDSGTLKIPTPPESVGTWPVFGKPLMDFWILASTNFDAALQQTGPYLKQLGGWLLSAAESMGLGIIQFIAAVFISGYLVTQAERGRDFTLMIVQRFVDERAEPLLDLSVATIHSVAMGILGVAAIQAILAGLGFFVAGVPLAGLLTILCLIFSVIQVGIGPVVIPLIIYMFYTADTFPAMVFLIWNIPITLIDNILRPIFFSRGVSTPMMVIFLGSLGGFMTSGIVGLFIGAVILSLTYELFMYWVKEGNRDMEN